MATASTMLYDADDYRADHHALIIDPTLDPTTIHNSGQEAVVNRGYFGLDNNDLHNDDNDSENSPERKAKQTQSRLFYENMASICEQAHRIEQDYYYMDTYDPYWNSPIAQHHNDWSYFDPEGKLEGVETWEEMVEAAPENFVDIKTEDGEFGMCSITDEYAQKLYGTPDQQTGTQEEQKAQDAANQPLIKTDVNMSGAFAGSANPDTGAATQSAPAASLPQKPAMQMDAAIA